MAVSISDDKATIDKIASRQQLRTLRIAIGQDWQARFGLSDSIPQTVLVDDGRIKTVHASVLLDPVKQLEADVTAVHDNAATDLPAASPPSHL